MEEELIYVPATVISLFHVSPASPCSSSEVGPPSPGRVIEARRR